MKHRFDMMFAEGAKLDLEEVYDAYETRCFYEFKGHPTEGNWQIFKSASDLLKRFKNKDEDYETGKN